MNCKPNTLAVFIRPLPVVDSYTGCQVAEIDVRGKIVTTVKLNAEQLWVIDPPFRVDVKYDGSRMAGMLLSIGDQYLRALEDKPGDDESLSWKCGKPKSFFKLPQLQLPAPKHMLLLAAPKV